MIKLFVSDLDGTLLNQYHTSDQQIERGISEVKARGYGFAVATGRHLRRHHQIGLKFLSMTDYLITLNGALVLDSKKEIIYQQAINQAKVQELILKFSQMSFELVTPKKILVTGSRWEHFWKGIKGVPKGKYKRKALGRAILNTLLGGFQYRTKREQLLEEAVLKVECITNSESDRLALMDYLDQEKAFFSYAYNDHAHFEITAQGVNKREGILQLLKQIKVHPDQVAVYGNDLNDLQMLSYFIHSYAPSSAVDQALNEAREVVGATKDHGVIKHIVETVRNQEAYRS